MAKMLCLRLVINGLTEETLKIWCFFKSQRDRAVRPPPVGAPLEKILIAVATLGNSMLCTYIRQRIKSTSDNSLQWKFNNFKLELLLQFSKVSDNTERGTILTSQRCAPVGTKNTAPPRYFDVNGCLLIFAFPVVLCPSSLADLLNGWLYVTVRFSARVYIDLSD